MAPQTPIHQMGLKDARRSLLMQIAELRRIERDVELQVLLDADGQAVTIQGMTDDVIEKTVGNLIVRNDNIMATVDHIGKMEAKA